VSQREDAPQRVNSPDSEETRISPFLANLLGALATLLKGRADLRKGTVSNDSGYMRLSLVGDSIVYIEGLYIDEEKQRQGNGTLFLQTLEAAVARLSMSTMEIRLWPVKSAIGFYLKNDFYLVVDTSEQDEYYNQRKKLFGDGWEKYTAVTRAAISEKAELNDYEDEKWNHDLLWPLFQKSGFPSDNPMFYSLWIGDMAQGDYSHACKVIQPKRAAQMSTSV